VKPNPKTCNIVTIPCLAAQDLTIEDLAAAGIYALTRHGLGEGLPSLDESRFSPPDPRDISECEGLLEVRCGWFESPSLSVQGSRNHCHMASSCTPIRGHGERALVSVKWPWCK
jgi:hypothetical protein